jgi:manganese oxidase
MELPLPDNTVPMMSGQGPFGALEMGGMFTVVKVRRDQKPGDYANPGWYRHPPGTVAHEFTGAVPLAPRAAAAPSTGRPAEVRIRKPGSGHAGHH